MGTRMWMGGQGAQVTQGTAGYFGVLGDTGGVSQTPGATVGRVPGDYRILQYLQMCVRATGNRIFFPKCASRR